MQQIFNTCKKFISGEKTFSLLLAFLIGGLFMALVGQNPVTAYQAMADGSIFSALGISNTLQRAIPLVGMAMATSIAFRAGILNIGTEGQMVVGGTVAALVALYCPGSGIIVMILALLSGFTAGGAWALISAGFQFWPGVPILISSLLLAYPARYISSWMIRFPFNDTSTSLVATKKFSPDVQIPMLIGAHTGAEKIIRPIFGRGSGVEMVLSQINGGIFIVLAIVIFAIFLNKRTVFGYESGMAGLNPLFAQYGGSNSKMLIVKTMFLSGGVSGIIGTIVVIGAPNNRLIEGAIISTNYAWTGLLVALLALYNPLTVLVAGVFFGAVMAGSGAMSRTLAISPQIAAVIQGLVIILIAFKVKWPKFKKKTVSITPTALVKGSEKESDKEGV